MPDRITSPEQLNNYIRVTNPGVWIILAAIIVFLAGFLFWLLTGELEISFSAQVYTEDKISRAVLSPENFSQVREGLTVRIPGTKITGKIIRLSRENNSVAVKFNETPTYQARAVFVIDRVRPIHFLLR